MLNPSLRHLPSAEIAAGESLSEKRQDKKVRLEN